MKSLDVTSLEMRELYKLLVGAVSPRPIALVATKGKEGLNLAPFSFFNIVSVNPAMLMFSPLRRMRDGTQKDTYINLKDHPYCTIQIVTEDVVEKVNQCSKDVPPEVNEFELSGLNTIESDTIDIPRVKESPFQMECSVSQIISLGEKGGAGNLVLCEIKKIHYDEKIMHEGNIDPNAVRLVGRNNASYYTRAFQSALFELNRP